MNLKNKIALSLGIFGSVFATGLSLADEIILSNVELPENFTVTAHTGCDNTKANSLDSILLGAGYKADIVEFDLFFDKSGKAVLSHDEPKADAVSFDEAFKLISEINDIKVNVDVKRTDDLRQVAELAEKYGIADRIFYTGISAEFVAAVKEQTPQIMYYLNKSIDSSKIEDDTYIAELISEVKELGAVGLNIHFKSCSKKLVDAFHSEGLLVSIWTVNKKLDMVKALTLECDNITTKKVEEFVSFVAKTKNR